MSRAPASVLASPSMIRPLARSTLAPAQVACLADPQAGKDQRGGERATPARSSELAVVDLGSGVKEGLDRLGAVQEHRPRLARLELAVLRVDSDRVARDQVALLGDSEDLPESG